jgi:hypothetical protein
MGRAVAGVGCAPELKVLLLLGLPLEHEVDGLLLRRLRLRQALAHLGAADKQPETNASVAAKVTTSLTEDLGATARRKQDWDKGRESCVQIFVS